MRLEVKELTQRRLINLFEVMFFLIISSLTVSAITTCGTYDQDQTTCQAQADCEWMSDSWGSWCAPKGCWNFQDNASCSTSNSTINQSCTWRTPQASYGWCQDIGCWNFQNTNQSACESNNLNLTCTWTESTKSCYTPLGCNSYTNQSSCSGKTGFSSKACSWDSTNTRCSERSCFEHDGNQTACEAESSLNCKWESPFCRELGCWNYFNESACGANNCDWHIQDDSGWCEEARCWQFDNISLGGTATEAGCVNNTFSLNCAWDNNGGWCYENVTSSCGDFSNERSCLDSFYCFWDPNSGVCNDPVDGGSFFTAFNPGCYIFDFNQTVCGGTNGCQWNSTLNSCSGANEIFCQNLTDSTICNEMTMMGTCCEWKAGSCQSTFAATCWDQMDDPPQGAAYCEDYNSFDNEGLCNQIAGPPWFMPCEWNNVTELCKFKASDIFTEGGGVGKLIEIDSRRTCESAGGQWVTESYCEGNVSVPAGRCEPKFDQVNNCNQACFACDKQGNSSAWGSAADAQTACEDSLKGCKFNSDSTAPNGFGFCNSKDVFKKGIAGDCQSDCRGCTYLKNAETECSNSKASCKWDGAVSQCVKKQDKTCNDACDRCYDENSCVNFGRGNANACKWENDFCKPAAGSAEICWNGLDDDDDNTIDCADSNCFGDPSCGGDVSGSNCFAFNTNSTCSAASGCIWFTDSWGSFCEFEGAICWQNDGDEATCNSASGCEWHNAFGGGECDFDWDQGEQCWQLGNNQTACAANSNCTFINDSFGGGFCEFSTFSGGQNCFTYDNNESACNAAADCNWFQGEFHSFCDPVGASVCLNNATLQNNATLCNAQPSCTYSTGFCDPQGFGGASFADNGLSGLSCFSNDGNETACTNKTGCSWFSNPGSGFCDMDRSCQSSAFFNNQTMCENAGCTYQSVPFNDCYPAGEICFRNQTLQMNQTACNNQSACQWNVDIGSCEPVCFNNNDQNSCESANSCIWMNGFCEDSKNVQSFTNMQQGAPVELGRDAQGDANSTSTDLVGYGMKDMGEYLGFGGSVVDISAASICNGQFIDSLGQQGQGQETTKFFVYLDSDGSTTGNCALHSDAGSTGWEFFLSYSASVSGTTVTETLSGYRCVSNSWVVSDITLSSFRALMCSDIGGPMLAVEEADLLKFSSLYDLEKDMRIYVATANNDTNVSNPSDTSGPDWTTPGSVDFSIEDMFAYNADTSAYEDILKQGYVPYEDCYNGVDDDKDGNIDCNDFDCSFADVCAGLGVNVPGFVDKTTPQVVGVKIENYPDSALIMYDTNKPANGSLLFYRNDSTCEALNSTILDAGILNSDVREYKSWHSAQLYDGTLGYGLDQNTTYYYKLKICDAGGKCALSKCSSLKTSFTNTCKYCNFVTRLIVPSGWYISYDIDIDGANLHTQGQVCGLQAGMKTNYTDGRVADVYLFDNLDRNATNASGIIFKNVTVTKSALNNKVRSINSDGAIAQGIQNSEQYVGLPSATRDKIINNLHPEVCQVKFPKPASGCTELWHCNDELGDCELRSDASLVSETTDHCLWQIPFCEFSVWSSGNLAGGGSSSSSSSSGGGGGGGGGAFSSSFGSSSSNVVIEKKKLWGYSSAEKLLEFFVNDVRVSLRRIEFALNSDTSGPGMSVLSLKDTPAGTSVLPDAYQYMEITTRKFTSEDLFDGAIINFLVPLSWLEENNIESQDIALFRWESPDWVELPTNYAGRSLPGNWEMYLSESPGFSYFAVAPKIQKDDELPEEIVGMVDELDVAEEIFEAEPEPAVEKPLNVEEVYDEKSSFPLLYLIGGMLIIVVAIAYVFIKKSEGVKYDKKEASDDSEKSDEY